MIEIHLKSWLGYSKTRQALSLGRACSQKKENCKYLILVLRLTMFYLNCCLRIFNGRPENGKYLQQRRVKTQT